MNDPQVNHDVPVPDADGGGDPLPLHEHLHGDPFTFESFAKDMEGREWDVVVAMYGRLRFIASALAGRTRKFVGITGGRALMLPKHLPFPQGREVPLAEDHPTYTDRTLDDFGFAVANGERAVLALQDEGKFRATLVSYSMVYGPTATRQGLSPIVKRAMDGRRRIIVPGDGSQIDRVLYAANAAHTVVLAAVSDEADGRIFNAIDSVTYPVKESIEIVGQALGHEFEVVGISHPLAYDLCQGYAAPVTRQFTSAPQHALIGYRDAVQPSDAIADSARWLAAHPEFLASEAALGRGNPYAYDVEDRLIDSFTAWRASVPSM